ncbi:hypothetical protein CONCODRAFT_8953 [Conidiobolus coronatus NRRL 28638]|uniref:Uncharacterized protein n=1 Tax=Conidiobolus coronatus (strain ATCC 28846 / CBS 209.66 / NRRL 28638) TaxID=796925 RepID=A0A137P119_CONC2|nr:hypothetical protein CONCODRAFT_8953 [Conidiobolus coronatus NRRL 28638]|eukprot:KXN68743.1 hypothetical protein CONCODRAFT_8953 [Conidiobolus coronatus NRRL 28638]
MAKETQYTIEIPDPKKFHLSIKKEGNLQFLYSINYLKNKFKNVHNTLLAETRLEVGFTRVSECIIGREYGFQKLNFVKKLNRLYVLRKNWGSRCESDYLTYLPINSSMQWSIILNDNFTQCIGSIQLENYRDSKSLDKLANSEEQSLYPNANLKISINPDLPEEIRLIILISSSLIFKHIIKEFTKDKRKLFEIGLLKSLANPIN